MFKTAIVNQVTPEIIVTPLEKSECTTCSQGCSKNSTQLQVLNPDNLEIKPGIFVKIFTSRKNQIIQGNVAILVPIIFAVCGYFLSTPIISLFNKTPGDGIKALFVLIFLIVPSFIILILSKKFGKYSMPKITEIVDLK